MPTSYVLIRANDPRRQRKADVFLSDPVLHVSVVRTATPRAAVVHTRHGVVTITKQILWDATVSWMPARITDEWVTADTDMWIEPRVPLHLLSREVAAAGPQLLQTTVVGALGNVEHIKLSWAIVFSYDHIQTSQYTSTTVHDASDAALLSHVPEHVHVHPQVDADGELLDVVATPTQAPQPPTPTQCHVQCVVLALMWMWIMAWIHVVM